MNWSHSLWYLTASSPNRSPTICGRAQLLAALWSPLACCPEVPLLVSLPTPTPLVRPPLLLTMATWASQISRTNLATCLSITSSAQTRFSRRQVTQLLTPNLSLRGGHPASPCCAWRPRSTQPTSRGPCDQGSQKARILCGNLLFFFNYHFLHKKSEKVNCSEKKKLYVTHSEALTSLSLLGGLEFTLLLLMVLYLLKK